MSVPTRYGVFELSELIRSGGGGSVYRALDTQSGSLAAVKLAHVESPAAVSSLRREVATLLALNDAGVPGIVKVLASGVAEPTPWFAMELLDGADLRALRDELTLAEQTSSRHDPARGLAETVPAAAGDANAYAARVADVRRATTAAPRQPLSSERLRTALVIGKEIANTLSEVHALGLLHGDLTPANIVLRTAEAPVLLDFGTSFAIFERTHFREPARLDFQLYGTPGYAAPELLRGDSVDLRCDIYGLGCILFELLHGRPLFSGSQIRDIVQQHLHSAPNLSDSGDLPAPLVQLLLKMLAKAPEQRLSDTRLVVDTLSSLLGTPTSPAKGPTRMALLRPRHVGQYESMQTLLQALTQASQGQAQTILVTAPSGGGKTRLLNELGASAIKASATVLSCLAASTKSSDETQFSNPGLSLLEPLRQHAQQIYRQLREIQGSSYELPQWQDVARELRLLEGPLEPEPEQEASADERRQRTFDAVEQLIKLLADRQTLVVLFDDLQWADELSLAFLVERSGRLRNLRVLLVATIRDDSNSERVTTLRSWALREVSLPPLERAECGELVKSLLGTDTLPEGLLDYLSSRSEGNPFFIGEYLRAALNRRTLRREQGELWCFPTPTELRGQALDVPRNVDDLITTRLMTVSDLARQLLSRAAVLGREFDEELLLVQVGDVELASTRALQELVANQLLTQVAVGRYRFVHDRIREAAEQALPIAVRQRLHRSAATAIEVSPQPRDTSVLARLGYHWAAAGEPSPALRYMEEAASIAKETTDVDFACELYRAAIVQARKLEYGVDQVRVVNLNEALGEALVMRAKHAEARQCYEEAFAFATGEPLLRARIKRKHAATHWTQHDCAIAQGILAEAERELGSPRSDSNHELWQEYVQIQLGRFECMYFSGQRGAEVDQLVDTLESPVQEYATPRQRNSYYVASSSHHLLRNRYAYQEKAVELAWRAVRASEGLTLDRRALAHLSYGFSLFFGTRAQCRDALPYFDFAVDGARRTKAATLLARATTYRTLTLLRLGQLERVEEAVQQLAAAAEGAGIPPYIAAASAVRGWLDWRRDRASAAEWLEKARATWLTHKQPFPFRWVAGFPLLSLALARDDFGLAQSLLEDLLHPSQQAMPSAVVEAIGRAIAAIDQTDFVSAATDVASVRRLAEELGYC